MGIALSPAWNGIPLVLASKRLAVHHLAAGAVEQTLTGWISLLETTESAAPERLLLIGNSSAPVANLVHAMQTCGARVVWSERHASPQGTHETTERSAPPGTPQRHPLQVPAVSELWFIQAVRGGQGFAFQRESPATAFMAMLSGVTSEHCASEWLRMIQTTATLAECTPAFAVTLPADAVRIREAASCYMQYAKTCVNAAKA
jgi:hypothetical protein